MTPIDIATGVAGTPITVGTAPAGLAFSADGKYLYVANTGSNTVTPITVATGTAGTAIPVGHNPIPLAITPDQAPVESLSVSAEAGGNAITL